MKWALVLSGGGARGLAHIGLLRKLEELGCPPPSFIAGCSMGAIVGALYAAGWSADRIEDYALTFEIKRFLENPAFRLPDFALSRLLRAGAAMGALATGRAMDSGSKVLAELERLLEGRRFEDMAIPFACVATDLCSGKERVFDSGPLAIALRASMSVPGVFSPVALGEDFLVDGGIVNNLPCSVARARGYKKILASDVSPFLAQSPAMLASGTSILLRSFDVAAHMALLPSEALASVKVVSDGEITSFQFDEVQAAVRMGEDGFNASLPEIRRFFRLSPFHLGEFLAKLLKWNDSTAP
jgi:NTE family protein